MHDRCRIIVQQLEAARPAAKSAHLCQAGGRLVDRVHQRLRYSRGSACLADHYSMMTVSADFDHLSARRMANVDPSERKVAFLTCSPRQRNAHFPERHRHELIQQKA